MTEGKTSGHNLLRILQVLFFLNFVVLVGLVPYAENIAHRYSVWIVTIAAWILAIANIVGWWLATMYEKYGENGKIFARKPPREFVLRMICWNLFWFTLLTVNYVVVSGR